MPQNGDCSTESNVRTLVFRNNVITKLGMERIHFQIMLSDVGYSSFEILVSILRRKGAGGPSISHEDVDRIQEAFYRRPQNPIKWASLQLGIPRMTIWRNVHNCLHLHAYKVLIMQALKPDDKPRRFQIAKDILLNLEDDENCFRRRIFSDEATFKYQGG
jgi:hypothetical protein